MSRNGTGSGDQPAGDEHGLAAHPVGQPPGEVVRERLGDAEHDDERQDGRPRREVELAARPTRAGCSRSSPTIAPTNALTTDQQRELAPVPREAQLRRVRGVESVNGSRGR